MPRETIYLGDPAGQELVKGTWRYARGYVPGEPNEGLVEQSAGSPARLADYDDSGWEICHDLAERNSHGFSFMWYRINITLPDTVNGHPVDGIRVQFETCIDTTTARSGSTANATATGAPSRASTCPSGCC